MSKQNKMYLGLTILFLSLIVSPILPLTVGVSSKNSPVENSPPTVYDVENLLSNFEKTKIGEEQLYLIYFDSESSLNEFISHHSVEMVFRGLEGVVIKTDSAMVDKLSETYSFITKNNIFRIENKPRNYVTRNSYTSDIKTSVATQSSAAQIGVTQMWDLGFKGQGTTIGIFDTGIYEQHPDFIFPNGTSRVIASEGFVKTIYGNEENKTNTPGSHGTGVAGYAAGGGILNSNNIGMAPEAWLLDADLDESPESTLDMTVLGEIAAINWALENGVDIINRSYGPSKNFELYYWNMLLDPNEVICYYTIRRAIEKGVLFVHSAGNSGAGEYKIDASNLVNEISVGASDESMTSRATYSSTGPTWGTNSIAPDVIAPGTEIATTSSSGGYFVSTGTSQSSPHVAGGAAVLLSAMRAEGLDVNPGTLKAALMASAYAIYPDIPWEIGTGQINVYNAYQLLMNSTKIGNHPIVGATNPRNLSTYIPGNYPIPRLSQGMYYEAAHLTFVSSEMKNVTVNVIGNISEILSFKEQILVNKSYGAMEFQIQDLSSGLLSEAYSHDLVFCYNVSSNATLGNYTGTIVFKVNDTTILESPFSFEVFPSKKRILFHTRTAASFPYNSLGEFRDLVFYLSKENIVLNEYKGTITNDILESYDFTWIIASNRTYKQYFVDPFFYYLNHKVKDTPFSESEEIALLDYVKKGGSLLLTPVSTPIGIENLLNKWGIYTKEIKPITGGAPGIISHFSTVGKSTDYIDISGSFFEVKGSATPLAYLNKRENIVMASYDYPLGGRVLVLSGPAFVTNRGYSNSISSLETHNDRVLKDMLQWLSTDVQLFGTYEITGDSEVLVSLHASNNGTINNSANIKGKMIDKSSSTETNITDLIPKSGNNGWYNFTMSLAQGLTIFNFTWGSDFIAFEIITDHNPPIIGISGMANNSYLYKTEEIFIYFDDLESGIDKYEAYLTIDGEKVGFNGPKENKTHSGYYIEKKLYPENYKAGTHILKITVQDLAANSVTISFVFIRGSPPSDSTNTSKSPGFELGIIIVSFIWTVFAVHLVKKKIRRD
ncbi:MAG: S8 family peptidase [Candidatus Hodarchaeales archaeon]